MSEKKNAQETVEIEQTELNEEALEKVSGGLILDDMTNP